MVPKPRVHEAEEHPEVEASVQEPPGFVCPKAL